MKRMVVLLLIGLTAACTPAAEEIHVLSTGPLEDGLVTLIETYTEQFGHTVTLETGTTPVVRERLETGDMFDVVIARLDVIDEAGARGQLDASVAPVVGSVGVGIAVRDGVEVPSVENGDEVRELLLSADTVAYNRGSSGVYVQSLVESLGITEEIADRTIRFDNGTEVIAHVREGSRRDLGLAPMTEIQANQSAGVRMIPLPADVQNNTIYHAAVGTGAVAPASEFVEFLILPSSQAVFQSTGVQ